MEEVACNLCETRNFTVARTSTVSDRLYGAYCMTNHAAGWHYRIVRCKNCGLLYCSPRPTADQLAEFYAGLEDTAYAAEKDGRTRTAVMQVGDLLRFAPHGRLLELGSACGFFLNAARDAGFETVGIEPSHWARSYAKENFGLSLLEGALETHGFPDQHFDAVCMFDVLEHLPDPRGTLVEIARVTRSGGVVCVSTPDAGSWVARLLGGSWWGLKPGHLFYFSRQTLSRLLSLARIDLCEVRVLVREFTLAYWVRSLKPYSGFLWPLLTPLTRDPLGQRTLRVGFPDQMAVIARKR
ncbi:MAG: methyltransferase domain-containing protein [Anaerolineae bacterium]|nr:methyltransferase domain-containing protein [Anaerolineae bacterium]NIN93445.1 methyltransferase domain-containing protein [Anaerolineae bacterium]NIQ76545.1 methyltransferase domain-containing protein [Anaerolineae bacterium]